VLAWWANFMTFQVALYEGTGAQPLENSNRSRSSANCCSRPPRSRLSAPTENVSHPAAGALLVLGLLWTIPAVVLDETPVSVSFVDVEGMDVPAISTLVEERRTQADAPKPGAKRFPVIDYSRCTNCMQC